MRRLAHGDIRSIEESFSATPTRGKAPASFPWFSAGFVSPDMVSDSPGFLRLLGSFGFSARTGSFAANRSFSAGGEQEGIERCAWRGEEFGFLRALWSSDSPGFLRVSGSVGLLGKSVLSRDGFRSVIERWPCPRPGVRATLQLNRL